jgi:uncharacterized protein
MGWGARAADPGIGGGRVKFVNEIGIDAAAGELFEFLSDVERVAPCLPGARIDERSGDDYQGSMKVKVGPITGTYKGTMRFVELDRERRRAVMSARADEASGQGNAEAWIETEVSESNGRSQLRLVTDLQLRGRVAQFGRGTIERIAQRMFSEFANNIEHQMANGDAPDDREQDAESERERAGSREREPEQSEPREESADTHRQPRTQQRPASEEDGERPGLDALGLIAGPVVQKALPVLVPALVGFGYGYLLGRLRELKR